jgi:hypothetical protein
MNKVLNYRKIKEKVKKYVIKVAKKYYPKKANHIKMDFYDFVTFVAMANLYFRSYYQAYKILIEEEKLFPNVRLNKLYERINRWKKILLKIKEDAERYFVSNV